MSQNNQKLKRIITADITPEKAEKKVIVAGYVHETRILGRIAFIVLRDFSGTVQLTAIKNQTPEETFNRIKQLTNETVIQATGIIKANPQAPRGIEIILESINILSKAEPLPITVTEKGIKIGLDKRLDYRCIDLRKPENKAIFIIQNAIVGGFIEWFRKNGFIRVFTPCIIGSSSESGAEIFEIKYFDRKAYLRQDPQLHRQLTIAGGFEKIYDIGPSWRAELSHTTKHLCEHRSCAAEIAYIKDETDTMRIEEQLVISALKHVKKTCKEKLELFNAKIKIPETPFPELRFPKIYDILKSLGKELPEGSDLDTESEKLLAEYVKKKYHAEFFFINRFPFAIKPFYVMRVDDQPLYARSVDFYFGEIELSSGGQREHRYEKIMEQIRIKGMNPKLLEWFTKFFKWGVPPHGGFSIGIERFTEALLKLDNIRKAVLFPRDPERVLP
ncbi:aspartate--tRNA(Asn) ligase [Candidatus Woesearchaeota archaeon]|nr:aspartate--tRNA(Asn) ligase [Candidatus Woesearchaeota archaeon]RLE41003.1 MAG: aspartate--tRNA(Asn) ligase [Candidatus Woesearchaeota archaeon]